MSDKQQKTGSKGKQDTAFCNAFKDANTIEEFNSISENMIKNSSVSDFINNFKLGSAAKINEEFFRNTYKKLRTNSQKDFDFNKEKIQFEKDDYTKYQDERLDTNLIAIPSNRLSICKDQSVQTQITTLSTGLDDKLNYDVEVVFTEMIKQQPGAKFVIFDQKPENYIYHYTKPTAYTSTYFKTITLEEKNRIDPPVLKLDSPICFRLGALLKQNYTFQEVTLFLMYGVNKKDIRRIIDIERGNIKPITRLYFTPIFDRRGGLGEEPKLTTSGLQISLYTSDASTIVKAQYLTYRVSSNTVEISQPNPDNTLDTTKCCGLNADANKLVYFKTLMYVFYQNIVKYKDQYEFLNTEGITGEEIINDVLNCYAASNKTILFEFPRDIKWMGQTLDTLDIPQKKIFLQRYNIKENITYLKGKSFKQNQNAGAGIQEQNRFQEEADM